MVDIYLPDFKYGLEEDGRLFSDAAQYPKYAMASIQEMVRQVGDDLKLENGVAVSGIIIRHLVLPGRLENSMAVLKLLKEELSTNVPVSLMSQYTPIRSVRSHPQLGRRITNAEYSQVLDYALNLGFENLYIQHVNDDVMTPDFNSETPFEKSGNTDEQ
jgi:putative pyruvate formate lyase activating enzyme